MKAFDILRAIVAHQHTNYQLLYTSETRELEVHCGSIEKNRWYIFCDNPQFGLADACGLLRKERFYAYIIEE